MGTKDGFLKVRRVENKEISPLERIKNYNEFHQPMDGEKRKEQASRCMNCGVPYCGFGKNIEGKSVGCPLHNLCPEFNDALSKGEYELALKRLLKRNPFPEFTSRVCPALCEKACVAGLNFEPVSTKDDEFEIIEHAFENGLMKPHHYLRNGKKIAIIGSGPAGLAAANRLNARGYQVSVYEKADRAGGLLMYGIPNMKLEKSVIERRINLLKEEGILFHCNESIDSKKKADELMKENDVVILACGSESPRKLGVENEDAQGVCYAVDFLTKTTKALLDKKDFEIDAQGKDVVIVGGGDTGNDCLASCLRMGTKSVIQLEIMSEPPLERGENNPWPLYPLTKKTDYGQMEAIAIFGKDPRAYETTIDSIETKDGKIVSITTIKLEKRIEDGKVGFVKLEKTKKKLPCDLLLIAAGFVGYDEKLSQAFGLESQRGRAASKNHFVHDNLFVCGDMENGPSLVVKALASGMECAEEVTKFIEG